VPGPPAAAAAAAAAAAWLLTRARAALRCPRRCGLAWRTLQGSGAPPVGGLGVYGPWHQGTHYVPCLFNESADLREQTDLSPHHAPTVRC
jgi:hypothetical protein